MKYPNGYFKIKACPTCSKEFTPSAPSQMYCAKECKGKNAYYKRNYGITEEQYEAKKTLQKNCCMICGSAGFTIGKKGHTEKLVVDHDHETGQTRDLLCHNCNRGLGLLKDNLEVVESALEYLKQWKGIKDGRN
jgi:hypothetical protein